MSDKSKIELVKLNIKQFFSEMNLHWKEKKQYQLDKLIQDLPAENSGYEDLAPESNIKNGEEYLKALHWGVKNRKVKNIALAGPYGSGKSSIIQSYLNKYPSTKALKISLATFDFEKNEDEDFENEIELGILKQLFYKVDSDKIPQSRYRKIKKKYYRRYFLVTAVTVIIIMIGIAFFAPNIMENVLSKIKESGKYYKVGEVQTYIITGLFGILGISLFSYIIKWCSLKFRVKEVNLADKATVAVEKDENSIFDKSMDEIVYFFEATEYNIVFIEDLDRFDSTKIFVKLRELNTILNNYDLIKRRIVFVYAIKDDMFKDKERTKFFDFIVPVIPIINSTNSGEILREKLKVEKQVDGTVKSSLFDISASYITLVSPFIEDMRVLTSICNEFIIYKNTLNSVKLKDEELLSMMIFKNLYPGDFAELEAEKGIVKQAFDDKRQYIIDQQRKIEKKKGEYEKILNEIKSDVLDDVKEVKAAFLDYLVGTNGPFGCCRIDGSDFSYSEIMSQEFDISIFKNASKIEIYKSDYRYSRDLVSRITQAKTDVREKIAEYCFRIECLNNSEASRKEEIRKKIEVCDRTISVLHTYTLKNLVEKFGSEEIFSEDVKENKLLIFLIRKGFINENYADYINYFHPNSITKDEMNYIRGIRMQEAVGDFSYSIRNVDEVCERIEDYEFRQIETLNFDITDYLLTKRTKDNKCIEFFKGFEECDKGHEEFIRAYIERKINVDIFVNMLCKYYKWFWLSISSSNLFTDERKFYYLYLILEYADLEDVTEMGELLGEDEDENEIEGIADFIGKNKQALVMLSKVSTEKMIEAIEQLEIIFEQIEIADVDKKVVKYIFENDYYELNMNMLQSMFEFYYPDKVDELATANYTVISETENASLLDRIHNNFEDYVSKLVVGQETNVNESTDSVKDIIERLLAVNLDLCFRTLDKSNILWEDISECCRATEERKQGCKTIWDHILKTRKVKETWHNFLVYYGYFGLTSELVEWVSSSIDLLMQEERSDQFTDELLKKLITTNISIHAFTKLIEKYRVEIFDCKISSFEEERIAILIKNTWIPFTVEYLEEMKQDALNLVLDFICYNKEVFMQNLESVTLDVDTIAELLKSNLFEDEEKLQLFELFAPKDMTQKMAVVIRNLEIKLKKAYIESAWNLLEESNRYQLLLNQLEVYTVEEISEKFKSLAPVYKALSDISRRHKEYLDTNEYNKSLLCKLKKKNYITSFEEESYSKEDPITHKKQEFKHFGVWVKQKQ